MTGKSNPPHRSTAKDFSTTVNLICHPFAGWRTSVGFVILDPGFHACSVCGFRCKPPGVGFYHRCAEAPYPEA
jgi:hypothetical protein